VLPVHEPLAQELSGERGNAVANSGLDVVQRGAVLDRETLARAEEELDDLDGRVVVTEVAGRVSKCRWELLDEEVLEAVEIFEVVVIKPQCLRVDEVVCGKDNLVSGITGVEPFFVELPECLVYLGRDVATARRERRLDVDAELGLVCLPREAVLDGVARGCREAWNIADLLRQVRAGAWA
jgi:hypothetical protein